MTQRIQYIDSNLARALCCAVSVTTMAVAGEGSPQQQRYDLPQGDATRTLNLFADISGRQIVFTMDKVRGQRTNAVAGAMPAHEALARMLDGTLLVAIEDPRTGAFIVSQKKPAEAVEPEGEVQRSDEPQTKEPPMKKSPLLRRAIALLSVLGSTFASAASSPDAQTSTADASPAGPAIELSAFTVDASTNRGYHAANALSGTRSQIPLKDLPQSVNVVTSEFIADLGARNVEQALSFSPGVRKSTEFEGILSVRGFREASQRLNGFPTAVGGRWDPIALERVEVVKGPSAALYGSSANAGGFANLITKKPQFTAARSAQFSVGSEGRTYSAIDLTGPISLGADRPQLAYRLVGSYQDGSHVDWRDFTDGHRRFLMPSATLKLGSKTQMTVEYVYDDYSRVMDQVIQPLRAPDQSSYFFDAIPAERNINGPDSFDHYKNRAAYAYLTHQFSPALAFRGVASRQEIRNRYLRRSGFVELANNPGRAGMFPVLVDEQTERNWYRADLQWRQATRGGDFMVLAGVQHSDDIADQENWSGATVPFPVLNPTPADLAITGNPAAFPKTNDREILTRQSLGNVVASWKFLRRATLMASYARILDHKSRQINRLTGGNRENTPWNTTTDPDDWQVGFVFELTPELNVYAVHSRDRSLNAFDDSGIRLPNLEQDLNEVGLKFSRGNSLNANLAVFEIERANIAQRDFSLPTRPLIPAGNVRSRGVELELFWNPTDAFTAVAAYTHLDAKVAKNVTRPSLVGVPLGDSPDNYFSLWGRYTLMTGSAEGLELGLGLQYSEAFHPFGGTFDIQNRAFARVPGYTVLNAMVRYPFKLRGHEHELQLNINNLTDETYFLATDFGAPLHGELTWKFRF